MNVRNNTAVALGAVTALFYVKPVFDLLWPYRVVIAGKSMALLHAAGLFVLIYFGFKILVATGRRAPMARLFFAFILVNIVSILVAVFARDLIFINVMDTMVRIVDSFIMLNIGYLLMKDYGYEGCKKLIYSVAVGTFIALAINAVAITMGFGHIVESSNASLRQAGLYYDPGVMSNIALYNIIFCAFLYTLPAAKNNLIKLFCIGSILISLGLIYIGLSRSVVIELAVFILVFVSVYLKGSGRVMAISGGALVVVIAVGIAGVNLESYTQRFQSEIETLESDDVKTGSVDPNRTVRFGKYERLGSNRVKNWAIALDEIIKRPVGPLLFGNFKTTKAHSDYIDILSRNGFIGFILYIVLLTMVWAKLLSRIRKTEVDDPTRPLYALAFSLMTLYILYSFPFRPLNYTTISWIMWAFIGAALARDVVWFGEEPEQNLVAEDEIVDPHLGKLPILARSGRPV